MLLWLWGTMQCSLLLRRGRFGGGLATDTVSFGVMQAVEIIRGHLTAGGTPQRTCNALRRCDPPVLHSEDRAGTGAALICEVVEGQLVSGKILRQRHSSRIPFCGTIRN